MSIPSFQPQRLSCKCGHSFVGHLPIHVAIPVWTAALKATFCPSCGKSYRSLSFGGAPTEEVVPDASDRSDEDRRRSWLLLRDDGMSSLCIADFMCGTKPLRINHPHDPADFGRCERLLRRFPMWRERFGQMAALDPYWAALVPRWNDIVAFWDRDSESPKAQAGTTYALMRSILDPIRDADHSVVNLGSGITMRVA